MNSPWAKNKFVSCENTNAYMFMMQMTPMVRKTRRSRKLCRALRPLTSSCICCICVRNSAISSDLDTIRNGPWTSCDKICDFLWCHLYQPKTRKKHAPLLLKNMRMHGNTYDHMGWYSLLGLLSLRGRRTLHLHCSWCNEPVLLSGRRRNCAKLGGR